MTPETYTRDSDKQKVIITEVAEVARMKLYSIKPIEENPMPEILPGDYLVQSKKRDIFTYVTVTHIRRGSTFYNVYEHWRDGKLLWEAKK